MGLQGWRAGWRGGARPAHGQAVPGRDGAGLVPTRLPARPATAGRQGMTTTERLIFQNDSDGDLQFQNDTPLNVYFVVDGEEPIAPDYDVQAAVDILFPGL